MHHYFKIFVWAVVLIFPVLLSISSVSKAEAVAVPELESSPYDLIDAVNALRVSNGLPAYSISSILMYTAQNQADFMAITGNVTHTGQVVQVLRIVSSRQVIHWRAIFPLVDFARRILSAEPRSMLAQEAVKQWTGDAPHLDTMLSVHLSEIGAGVAISGDGRLYYVIDCAQPKAGNAPQVVTQAVGGGSAVPEAGAVVYPVIVSTPNADGNVIHEVRAGQSLWQIAIAYDVKIDNIKRLNNLSDNNIYPGSKLLIEMGATPLAGTATESPTLEAVTPTISPVPTMTHIQPTVTTSPIVPSSMSAQNQSTMRIAIGIIALALLAGGAFTWLGTVKKDNGS